MKDPDDEQAEITGNAPFRDPVSHIYQWLQVFNPSSKDASIRFSYVSQQISLFQLSTSSCHMPMMKIILAGSTGGIGSEMLEQCLQHPSVTSIVALSRRALSDSVTNSPKLKVIIMEDFTSYSDSVLRQLDGAQACVWLEFQRPRRVGHNQLICNQDPGRSGLRYPDSQTARQVSLDYTIAAANTFVTLGNGKTFNFVFCSGAAVERDQSKKLWVFKDSRQIKVAPFPRQIATHPDR